MSLSRNVAGLLFILCIPIALLTTNIRFIANESRVYQYAIGQFDGVQTTGIERGELLRASAALREYFNNNEDTFTFRVQTGDREVPLFNPRETVHLEDVKGRFRLLNRVQEVAVVYLLTYVAVVVLWAREVTVRALAVRVMIGSALTLALIGVVGAFGLSGFDSAWEQFHLLIFSNDFWRLNPRTDHLIQMFPPEFWQNIVFFVGVLAASQAALMLIGAGIYLGVTSRSARTNIVRSSPSPA